MAAPSIGGAGRVIAYGHWGRPVLFFPAEGGSAQDLEDRGIVPALAGPIEAGRIKLYSVDSHDGSTWSDSTLDLEERARRHERYHDWITGQVAPAIHGDCGGPVGIATAGVEPRRVPRREPGAAPGRPVPVRPRDVRELRPGGVGRLGRAWRRALLQQPVRVRPEPARRSPGVAAAHRVRPALRRHRRLGGAPHAVAALDPGAGPAARRQGPPARARRVGCGLPARLAVLGTDGREAPGSLG